MVDRSGPIGTWYLKKWYAGYNHHPHRLFTLTINIRYHNPSRSYRASLLNEEDYRGGGNSSSQIDQIRWDETDRRLVFCLHSTNTEDNSSQYWRWFNGTIVEGILVGRFSHRNNNPAEPSFGNGSAYDNHFTGWNINYIDGRSIVPRVYDIVLDADYRGITDGCKCHALLRIDKSNDDSSDFIGRLKVYRIGRYTPENENRTENPDGINCGSSNSNNNSICGEELEYDLNVRQWNGNRLDFTRIDRRLNQNWEQRFRGRIEGNDGQTISGTFTHTGISRQLYWRGTRAEVLTYGLVQKSRRDRQVWQERTRRQLYHLMMADNPHTISISMRPRSTLRPRTGTLINRDDNPSANPQEYKLTELFFDYALPNPYDRS